MSDFNKLGQIPPEEFKKAMAIKDINQREAAIKNLEKTSVQRKELATKDSKNPYGLVKGVGVDKKHETKFLSEQTKQHLVTAADYNVNSAINKGKAVPGVISGTSKLAEDDYVGGILDYVKASPALIRGTLQQVKGASATYKATKSFKADIKDLSKSDKASAMAEFAQATVNAHTKILEDKPDDVKQTVKDAFDSAKFLESHESRVKRAESIAPSVSTDNGVAYDFG